MNINALFFILLLIGGGYYFWAGNKSDKPGGGSDVTTPGPGGFVGTPLTPLLKTIDAVTEAKKQDEIRAESLKGFVDVPAFEGHDPEAVILFGPINCTSEVVAEIAALSEELTRLGIKNQRVDHVSLALSQIPPDQKKYNQFNAMTKTPPIVIIRGRAKANPSLAEIVQEYRGVAESS